jgi:protein-S-isoprenylcysteine O-methyltransferase
MAAFIRHWLGYVWVVFAIVWFLAAFTSKRSVQRQSYGSRILQSIILLIGADFIFDFFGTFRHGWLTTQIIHRTDAWLFFGAALVVFGILICFWARVILGRNWSGTVTLKQDHELIRRGPYSIVRHPIYTGLLTALLGSAITNGALRCFIGVPICTFAFWLKLQIEEQFMIQQFGEQYARYRQNVRALVPFVL